MLHCLLWASARTGKSHEPHKMTNAGYGFMNNKICNVRRSSLCRAHHRYLPSPPHVPYLHISGISWYTQNVEVTVHVHSPVQVPFWRVTQLLWKSGKTGESKFVQDRGVSTRWGQSTARKVSGMFWQVKSIPSQRKGSGCSAIHNTKYIHLWLWLGMVTGNLEYIVDLHKIARFCIWFLFIDHKQSNNVLTSEWMTPQMS